MPATTFGDIRPCRFYHWPLRLWPFRRVHRWRGRRFVVKKRS